MKIKCLFALSVLLSACLFLTAGCGQMSSPEDTRLSGKIIKHVDINKPPDEVWAYMFVEAIDYDGSGRITVEWVPEWQCQSQRAPGEGTTCKATMEIAGETFTQEYSDVENIPNRKFTHHHAGDLNDTITYQLAPISNGTELSMIWEYSIDLPEGMSRQSMKKGIEELAGKMLEMAKQNVEGREVSEKALAAAAAGQEVSSLSGTNLWTVVIDAPVEKVFAYLTDLSKYPEWMDADETISNIQGQGLGTTYDWEIALGTTVFRGKTLIVDYIENRKLVNKSWGDVKATNTYLFMPENGKTRFTFHQNATVVTPGMTRGEWDAVVKARKGQFEEYLQKAKRILEK